MWGCTPQKERPSAEVDLDMDPSGFEIEQIGMREEINKLSQQVERLFAELEHKDEVIEIIHNDAVALRSAVDGMKNEQAIVKAEAAKAKQGSQHNIAAELDGMREELDAMNAEVAVLRTQSQVKRQNLPLF